MSHGDRTLRSLRRCRSLEVSTTDQDEREIEGDRWCDTSLACLRARHRSTLTTHRMPLDTPNAQACTGTQDTHANCCCV